MSDPDIERHLDLMTAQYRASRAAWEAAIREARKSGMSYRRIAARVGLSDVGAMKISNRESGSAGAGGPATN